MKRNAIALIAMIGMVVSSYFNWAAWFGFGGFLAGLALGLALSWFQRLVRLMLRSREEKFAHWLVTSVAKLGVIVIALVFCGLQLGVPHESGLEIYLIAWPWGTVGFIYELIRDSWLVYHEIYRMPKET